MGVDVPNTLEGSVSSRGISVILRGIPEVEMTPAAIKTVSLTEVSLAPRYS